VAAHQVFVAVVPRRFARPQEATGECLVPGGEAELVRGGGASGGHGGERFETAIQQVEKGALTRTGVRPQGPCDRARQRVRGCAVSCGN
jgi:hypothetical protein